MKFFTLEDTAAMAQPIYDAIQVSAPHYRMFSDDSRQHGLDLLARHRIEEGIALCLETRDAKRWGGGVRIPHRCATLRQYAGSAKSILPQLREMRYKTRSVDHRRSLEDAIRAIERDKNPRPTVSLHTLVNGRLAKDLLPAKDDQQRLKLCRELMKNNAEDYFYQAAGLRKLVSILGIDAFDDVLAAVGQPSEVLHAAAVKLGAQLPGEAMTKKWAEQLAGASGQKLAGILDILARRGDLKMLPVVKKHLKHKDQLVQAAAFRAVSNLAGEKEIPLLTASLIEAEDDSQRAVVEQAVVTSCRHAKNVDRAVTPVLEALEKASETPRCTLIHALGQVGGGKALTAVAAATNDENATLRKAAFDALATSPDPKATDILLKFAENASDAKKKNPALTGLLRRAITEQVPQGQKLGFLKRLIVLDGHGRIASTALSELRWSPSVDSLRLAQSCLDKERLAEPAAATAVAIAQGMDMGDKKQRDAAIQALKEVLGVTNNDTTSTDAKAFIAQHGQQDG